MSTRSADAPATRRSASPIGARSRPARAALSGQLRERTREDHLTAERAFSLEVRLADRARYGALLVALRSVYAPLEAALRELGDWDRLTPAVDIGARCRAALLDADLERLGIAPAITATQVGVEPRMTSMAHGLGCLYVLEGSAIGGRIVAPIARRALGDRLPVAFFMSSGRGDLGADWRSLRGTLDAFGARHGEVAARQVIGAARDTFAVLARRVAIAPRHS